MIYFKKSPLFFLISLALLGMPREIIAQNQPAIDPRAERILQEAANYLKAAKAFNFQADITFDDVAPIGLKLQYHSNANVFVARPNRFQIDYIGDRRNVSFYYDGKVFTLFDRKDNVYGYFDAPGTIDETLNRTVQDFSFLVPLADLVYSDPAKAIKGKIQQGYYLGLASIKGKPVHHLAFVQETVDWQIWIEEGKQPLIRKLVITYKNLEGSPQYIAIFPDWNMTWKPSQDIFTFKAPANADKIEFLPNSQPY